MSVPYNSSHIWRCRNQKQHRIKFLCVAISVVITGSNFLRLSCLSDTLPYCPTRSPPHQFALSSVQSIKCKAEAASPSSFYRTCTADANTVTKDGFFFFTLYVPCIVTNYINKPTRWAFCMYLFYNLCTTLHVSNGHFVHHQEFMIYCILQLCTNSANVSNCFVLIMYNSTCLERPFRSSSGVHDLLYSAALYKQCKSV